MKCLAGRQKVYSTPAMNAGKKACNTMRTHSIGGAGRGGLELGPAGSHTALVTLLLTTVYCEHVEKSDRDKTGEHGQSTHIKNLRTHTHTHLSIHMHTHTRI